ncbi:hypothetical protein V8E53_005520 [Lactarius tabidus]
MPLTSSPLPLPPTSPPSLHPPPHLTSLLMHLSSPHLTASSMAAVSGPSTARHPSPFRTAATPPSVVIVAPPPLCLLSPSPPRSALTYPALRRPSLPFPALAFAAPLRLECPTYLFH